MNAFDIFDYDLFFSRFLLCREVPKFSNFVEIFWNFNLQKKLFHVEYNSLNRGEVAKLARRLNWRILLSRES